MSIRTLVPTLIRIARVTLGVVFTAGFLLPLTIPFVSPFTLLSAALAGFCFVAPAIRRRLHRRAPRFLRLATAALALLLAFAAVETLVILSAYGKEETDADTIVIVLGAQVIGRAPSTELAGRIRAAAEYLEAHPQAICIAAGGQGADEIIPESTCIRDTLMQRYGIDGERIYEESLSTDTQENIANAKVIIEERGWTGQVVIVTSDYHMFRAKMLAARAGLDAWGYPASMDIRLAIPAFLRELMAFPIGWMGL